MDKLYSVGAYIRLSKESKAYAKDESLSIENQQTMLSKFIAMMPGWVEKRFYIDDGYTGGNFQRPAFLQMMEDVKNGYINLVLVKDLSRFGRNYLETGRYLEEELPALGCRFVSLAENIDTEDGENDILPFLNAMNDYYLKNLSGRIKTVLQAKAKDGQYLSGMVPYGYLRSKADHNRIVVDSYAAGIVQRVFTLRVQSLGYAKIAATLNADEIVPPRLYYYQRQNREPPATCTKLWQAPTVKALLRGEIYLGHTVQNKTGTRSYRDNSIVGKDEAEWIRAENTHEPLVDIGTWEKVRELDEQAREQAKSMQRTPQKSLFSKLLVCAGCGGSLVYDATVQTRKDGKVVRYGLYHCSTHAHSGGSACSRHTVSELALKKLVLEDIQAKAAKIELDANRVRERMAQKLNAICQPEKLDAQKEQRALKQRLYALEILTAQLYEDKVLGEISERSFTQQVASVETERQEKEKRLALLTQTEQETTGKLAGIEKWMGLVGQHAALEELDRETLDCLVEKIEVGESAYENGVRHQDIRIFYRFVGQM